MGQGFQNDAEVRVVLPGPEDGAAAHAVALGDVAALVVSPGVPLSHPQPHPVVVKAKQAGLEIIGDIELLFRQQADAGFIGITGTNGKSTTTALLAHIMNVAGMVHAVGGNLGVPALDLAPLQDGGVYVLEMSSYQLDLVSETTFDTAVLLNISPDHLDRHGGMQGYVASKCRVFDHFGRGQTTIIGIDDEHGKRLFEELKAEKDRNLLAVSGRGPVPGGVYVDDGCLIDDRDDDARMVVSLREIVSLTGQHNAQNAAAAYAAAVVNGVSPADAAAGIKTFPGLEHRQELVAVIDGIAYVNDSKATNGEAAARALACYGNIYWIAGGRAKEDGLGPTTPYLDHVCHTFLIGEAANDFSVELKGKVPCDLSGNLDKATRDARDTALREKHSDPVVLLSPAAASFDQFDDFEMRGNAFKEIVGTLPGERTFQKGGAA